MNTRIASFSILALVGLLLTTVAVQTKTIPLAVVSPAIQPQATNPPYLREMPTVERVMREVQGKDQADTAARRVATFRQLCAIISEMARASEGRYRQTPDEARIIANYGAAYTRIWQGRPELLPAVTSYESDAKFRDELLTKFFSAEFRATFNKTTGKQSPQTQSVQPSPSTGTGADAYVAQGKKYREAKDYAKAIEAFKKAVALQPSNSDAHFGLAISYYYQEQWQLSISAWKQYLTLVQPFPAALILLGDAHLQLKHYDEALKTFRSIISLAPDAKNLAEAHFSIGRTYNDMQQYENAVAAFKEALRFNPNAAHASRELGAAYYLLKQYPDALAALQRAVRLKPDDALAQYNLGKTYLAMGKKAEALQLYRTLLTIDKAKAQELYAEINKSK